MQVTVYFDYASPYSYLASEIVAKALPGVDLDWRPMYLRGLEAFSKGMPYTARKLAYLARDLTRSAQFLGVPVQPPHAFPINGLHALRAAYVAKDLDVFDRYHRSAFRAAWAEQRDVSDERVVVEILAAVLGREPAQNLAEAVRAQPIKERVRAATAEAEQRGVFGAPTFFVGEEMYWGHDRLDQVAKACGVVAS